MNRLVSLFLVFMTLLGCRSERSSPEHVRIVSWGGQYQESLFKHWVLPSVAASNIHVEGDAYGGEYQLITDMVGAGSVTWDLVQVETFYAERARREKLLAPLGENLKTVPLALPARYDRTLLSSAAPVIGWSYALAWNQSALSAAKRPAPTGWLDLWDVARYPGRRALRDTPQGNVEVALLALGMTKEDIERRLYKDHDLALVDAALKKLGELRGNVIWWRTGDQVQRELETASSVLVATWNGRAWLARTKPLVRTDRPSDIRITFADAILDYDWWIIPNGSEHAASSRRAIVAMYANVDGAIAFARDTGYSPPISGWEQSLPKDDELRDYMATTAEHMESQLTADYAFWAQYYAAINEKWRIWREAGH